MPLEPAVLDILRCPDTHHAPLTYDEPGQTLTCTECGRVFEIRDGIPDLILEEESGERRRTLESRTPRPDDHARDDEAS